VDAVPDIAIDGRRTIAVQKSLLEKNAAVAARLRARFRDAGVFVVNVLSSPGAGKTELLGRLLDEFGRRWRCGVIVGDLATDHDAQRLRGRGAPIVQLTTGHLCHLEASMIETALGHLPAGEADLLLIENVGNLVCPSGYDLGESLRVVVASVTEGEDKPLKYPVMYRTADLVLINKIDLAAAVGYDRARADASLDPVAPNAARFEVSARTGAGLDRWHDFLEAKVRASRES
jgi:hydrogenase nickel incorporation protein HypB